MISVLFILIGQIMSDTLIIGAGPTGLFSALEILKVNPTEKVWLR
jgi:thioredoxin reductase